MRRIVVCSFLMIAFVGVRIAALADEGMWLPQLLQALNEKEMKQMGMKINASDIYSINKSSLKDAIVSFGGFCTAEVISEKGLMLTNHHCGFSAIQSHSSLEHNYIKDGFWAKNFKEELKNPGLTATFIIRIDDVTKAVLQNTEQLKTPVEIQSQIDKNIASIKATVKKEAFQDIIIKPFFEGNKYYLFITETYRDVRMVGAPPSAIGNFGKDTDNWVWPRHTGDFALFRIYADKNNKPADYSAENVPYKPKNALKISLDGIVENDFTMVFGFPGRTTEYLHSSAVDQIMNLNDPAKIAIREKALNILDAYMRKNEKIKIQYASKYASIQNAYKKWQGEVLGLKKSNAVEKKKNYEKEFQRRVNANANWKESYGNILKDLEQQYDAFAPLSIARDYYNEVISKIEIFTIAAHLNNLIKGYNNNGEEGYNNTLIKVKDALQGFYKNYDKEVDENIFAGLMEMYFLNQFKGNIPETLSSKIENNDFKKFAKSIFNQTIFDDSAAVMNLLEKERTEVLQTVSNDIAMRTLIELQSNFISNYSNPLNKIQTEINALQTKYMKAQMEVFSEKKFYPDANSTLRVTYGKVKPYEPKDGVEYGYYTTLEGVMEKYVPGDYEFDVPEKLIELHKNKDYGPYAMNGKLPVCFIASNHTTGGNSGSPVLDAYGNLIGLNFDRVWEGTMSDINYDASICRNIMVDIRYVLFIIDKFANAQNIMKELKMVHPKKPSPKRNSEPQKKSVKKLDS